MFSEFFGNDAALLSNEYDAFDSASAHIVIIDPETCMPVGSARLITHSDHGFKSLADMAHGPGGTSQSRIEKFTASGSILRRHWIRQRLLSARTIDKA